MHHLVGAPPCIELFLELHHVQLQLLNVSFHFYTTLLMSLEIHHLLFQLLHVLVLVYTNILLSLDIRHSQIQLLNVPFTCTWRRWRRRWRLGLFDLDVPDHLASHASDLATQLKRVEGSGDGDRMAIVIVGDRPYSLLVSGSLELAEDLADLSVTPRAVKVNNYIQRGGL